MAAEAYWARLGEGYLALDWLRLTRRTGDGFLSAVVLSALIVVADFLTMTVCDFLGGDWLDLAPEDF